MAYLCIPFYEESAGKKPIFPITLYPIESLWKICLTVLALLSGDLSQ